MYVWGYGMLLLFVYRWRHRVRVGLRCVIIVCLQMEASCTCGATVCYYCLSTDGGIVYMWGYGMLLLFVYRWRHHVHVGLRYVIIISLQMEASCTCGAMVCYYCLSTDGGIVYVWGYGVLLLFVYRWRHRVRVGLRCVIIVCLQMEASYTCGATVCYYCLSTDGGIMYMWGYGMLLLFLYRWRHRVRVGLWCGLWESWWGSEGTETAGNTKTKHCRSGWRNVSQRCIDRYLHLLLLLVQNNLLNPVRSEWSIRRQRVLGKLSSCPVFPVNFLSSSTVLLHVPSGLPLSFPARVEPL